MKEKYTMNLIRENGDVLFSYPLTENSVGNLLDKTAERDRSFIKNIIDGRRFDTSLISEKNDGGTILYEFSLFPSSGALLGFDCEIPYKDARRFVISGLLPGIVCAEKARTDTEDGDFSEDVYSELGEIINVVCKPFRRMLECRSVSDAVELADDIARIFGTEFDINVPQEIGAMHLPRGTDIGLFTLFSVVTAGSVRTFKPKTHASLKVREERGLLFFDVKCPAENRRNLRLEGATEEIDNLSGLYAPLTEAVRRTGVPYDVSYEGDYSAEISPVREELSVTGLKAPDLFTRFNGETKEAKEAL